MLAWDSSRAGGRRRGHLKRSADQLSSHVLADKPRRRSRASTGLARPGRSRDRPSHGRVRPPATKTLKDLQICGVKCAEGCGRSGCRYSGCFNEARDVVCLFTRPSVRCTRRAPPLPRSNFRPCGTTLSILYLLLAANRRMSRVIAAYGIAPARPFCL